MIANRNKIILLFDKIQQSSTNGAFKVSTDFNAAFKLPFFGHTIEITLGNGPDGGMVDIWVDDFFWGTRDLYSASASEETFTIECYEDTAHWLEIRNRTDKNLASSGRKVGFKQAEVTTAYGLQTIDYTYDALARVTDAKYYTGQLTSGTPTREYAFAYDKSSNRTNETFFLAGIQQHSHNFSYNGVNQLSSGGFTYDDNGNLTHDGSHSYTWDRANRLLTHNGSSYAYNGLGQRVSQTVSSVVTQYLQDTQPGLFKTIKATVGANTERYIHDVTGVHSHEANNGDWSWTLTDGLNSVRDMRDAVGNSVYSTQYAPYGEKFGLTGSNPTPFEYTGEPFDQNGLSYHRARYYDPSTGVWASQDPLETPNRYGYVGGNPINKFDPTGMYDWPTLTTEEGDCIYCIGREGGVAENRLAAFTLLVASLNNGQSVLMDKTWPYRLYPRKLLVLPEFFEGVPVLQNGTNRRYGTDCPCGSSPSPQPYNSAYCASSQSTPTPFAELPPSDSSGVSCRNPLKLARNFFLLSILSSWGFPLSSMALEELTGHGIKTYGFAGNFQLAMPGVSAAGAVSLALMFDNRGSCRVFVSPQPYGASISSDPGIASFGAIMSTASLDELPGSGINLTIENVIPGIVLGYSVTNNQDCDLSAFVGPATSSTTGSITYSETLEWTCSDALNFVEEKLGIDLRSFLPF